ncbi:hypothetical protein CHS0354_032139 [Potamilus streckersoni]|uniref:Nitrate/nitrite transporter n=1 Tax=Potamilus streckersoni TaxID=2493646 RepID=A0AAE0THG9_9BIVA|nr:hypothetical protein CHS0354_032139 [Potamilus streckersoni]
MSYKKSSNLCQRILRKIQAKSISEDEFGKAKSFRFFSISRPHMRGFHTSWFTFFVAFTSWFSIQPLIPTIAEELSLSKVEIARSGIASISVTIFARVIIGPMCDKFGPRRMMSAIMILGSLPIALSGLIRNGTGLLIIRLFIGIIGASFIPCQFWTSAMFNQKIVGTANAIVAGWGNLGGGFTFILMPALFELVKICGADEFLAWKIALVIPAALCLGVGILIIWTSDDCPQGHWSKRKLPEVNLKVSVISSTRYNDDKKDAMRDKNEGDRKSEQIGIGVEKNQVANEVAERSGSSMFCVAGSYWMYFTVFVLSVHYGLSFGVEIAVDTVMNLYFLYRFKKENCTSASETHVPPFNLTNITTMSSPFHVTNDCSILSQNTASLIASLFGLMNFFARALGGVFSDLLYRNLAISGRLLAHMICLTCEGIMLIVFSQMTTIPSAIALMIVFSIFVQMGCGSTYSLVPYVNPRRVGVISGLIGAGGNAGAIIWNTIWADMVNDDQSRWFWVLGICVLVGSFFTLLIPIQNQRIWTLRRQNEHKIESKSGNVEEISTKL